MIPFAFDVFIKRKCLYRKENEITHGQIVVI